MSGGSFDYLYTDAPDLLHSISCRLWGMVEACDGEAENACKGGQPAAAGRIRRLAVMTEALQKEIESHKDLLRAVEWSVSGDTDMKDVGDKCAAMDKETA